MCTSAVPESLMECVLKNIQKMDGGNDCEIEIKISNCPARSGLLDAVYRGWRSGGSGWDAA